MRVLSVFGTRPEAIKMAPILRALAGEPWADSVVCVTAQHRELLDEALRGFAIVPNYDLGLMRPGQDPAALCGRIIDAVADVVGTVIPDIVLVQGDTVSTLAAALAAAYRRVAVGHVEAGLRTRDFDAPFPEEMHRRVVDQIARVCFAPTRSAERNLLEDGVAPERVIVTGNTVIDALDILGVTPRTQARRGGPRQILVTCHRRESFGSGIVSVCDAVRRIACDNPDVRVVFLLHPNPESGAVVARRLAAAPIDIRAPLPYVDLLDLVARSYLVLTDSGGIQEEAAALGTPVLVLRERTERIEGVEAGIARLVGTQTDAITAETQRILDDQVLHDQMSRPLNLYGDGYAARRIVGWLRHFAGVTADLPQRFVSFA